MKIQLDTDKKTIKLESDVKISKLLDTLKKLLPNGEYREFTLETNTVIQGWSSPVVIHDHWHDHYPHWQPWYSMTNNLVASKSNADYSVKNANMMSFKASKSIDDKVNTAMQLKSGVFNVEI